MELIASAVQPSARKRNKAQLSDLSRMARNGLLWVAFLFALIEVTLTGLAPPLASYGLGALICALVANTGRRWAPLPGAIWCIILVYILRRELFFDITHPIENKVLFAFSTFFMVGYIIAILGGIAATVQNYRRAPAERRAPRWVSFAVIAMVALTMGGNVVGATTQVQADITGGISPETLSKLPSITAAFVKFQQEQIHVKAGQLVVLRLDNRDVGVHSFDIDEFNVHAPMPIERSGLAVFTPTKPGSYKFYCSIPGHDRFMSGML